MALAILALTFGFAYQSLSGGIGWMDRGQHRDARFCLRNRYCERVGHDIPAQDGELSGRTDDGFFWRIDMTPYRDAATPASGVLAGHRIEIVAGWSGEGAKRQVRLLTVRLAPQPFGQRS